MQRSFGFGRWVAACVAAASVTCAAGPREVVIESMDERSGLAPRWEAGILEHGSDGTRSFLRATTPGDGATTLVANRVPYDPPIDFTGRFVKVEVRVDDTSRLAGMEFRLSSDGLRDDYFEFTIPLYAEPRFNVLQSGTWITWTFSFGSARVVGEPDRSRIDTVGWMVREREEAGGPLTAYWAGISAVDAPPRGIVTLTFDDGYDEHAQVAAPIMAEYGLRGTAYVMPDQVGTPGYASLEELSALHERYGWDVSAHDVEPLTARGAGLERRVVRIREFLIENGFGEGADHLAYPLGMHDAERVIPVVQRHFETARVASAGPETLPPADPYRLRVLNVLATTTPEEIRAAVRRAGEQREWLILMFHFLVEAADHETEFSIADFRRAVELIAGEDVAVRTVSEVWRDLPALPAAPR